MILSYVKGTLCLQRRAFSSHAVRADGGVRTGADVLKMLALGADAVMIGRPISVVSVGGLKEGVVAYLDQIKAELTQAMVLTGTAKASEADKNILFGG